jgi:hypothetical protein
VIDLRDEIYFEGDSIKDVHGTAPGSDGLEAASACGCPCRDFRGEPQYPRRSGFGARAREVRVTPGHSSACSTASENCWLTGPELCWRGPRVHKPGATELAAREAAGSET